MLRTTPKTGTAGASNKGRMRGGIGAKTDEGVRRGFVRRLVVAAVMLWSGVCAGELRAQKPPLLPEKDVAALANELSGETAKRNLEGIARFHRQRGSQGFHAAAELVAERLRAYGLSDVAILQFPEDGKIFYGTQRSRPAWDAEVGELLRGEGREGKDCAGERAAGGGAGFGGGKIRSGGNCELCAEPEDGLVGRG